MFLQNIKSFGKTLKVFWQNIMFFGKNTYLFFNPVFSGGLANFQIWYIVQKNEQKYAKNIPSLNLELWKAFFC